MVIKERLSLWSVGFNFFDYLNTIDEAFYTTLYQTILSSVSWARAMFWERKPVINFSLEQNSGLNGVASSWTLAPWGFILPKKLLSYFSKVFSGNGIRVESTLRLWNYKNTWLFSLLHSVNTGEVHTVCLDIRPKSR